MWKIIPLSKIVKNNYNYKGMDDFMSMRLKNNIERNGQVQNIIVRELDSGKYEIVNGEHRIDEMRKLKKKHAMCFNVGAVSRDDAVLLMIETNETNFDPNLYELGGLLSDIKNDVSVEDMVYELPYESDEIDRLIDLSMIEDSEPQFDDNFEDDIDGPPPSTDTKWVIIGDFKFKIDSEVYHKKLIDFAEELEIPVYEIDPESKDFKQALITKLKLV